MKKKYARRNEIAQIEHDGIVTNDGAEIERAFFYHFSALVSSNPANLERFKSDFWAFMPRFVDKTKLVVEGPITHEKVKTAIEAFETRKSPGPDGLSAALYKALKHTLSPLLVDVC